MSKQKTMKKRSPGQPKLPEWQKRKPIMIRVNDSERKKIKHLAKKAGLPVATYLRKRGLGEI